MTYLVMPIVEDLVIEKGSSYSSQRTGPEPLQSGDWALIYRDDVKDGHSGYCLTSPAEQKGRAPFGGAILAALMFLLEHEEEKFWHDIIRKANNIASDKFGGPMFDDPSNIIKREPPKMN